MFVRAPCRRPGARRHWAHWGALHRFTLSVLTSFRYGSFHTFTIFRVANCAFLGFLLALARVVSGGRTSNLLVTATPLFFLSAPNVSSFAVVGFAGCRPLRRARSLRAPGSFPVYARAQVAPVIPRSAARGAD